jgi:succinate-semialdehyde dehydrogenase/glutarate-semialdehyde dehydrogenase
MDQKRKWDHSEEALQDILDQVKRFERSRCKNCHRWKTSFEEGAYMQPTLLTNLKRRTFYEELFGPVASFIA